MERELKVEEESLPLVTATLRSEPSITQSSLRRSQRRKSKRKGPAASTFQSFAKSRGKKKKVKNEEGLDTECDELEASDLEDITKESNTIEEDDESDALASAVKMKEQKSAKAIELTKSSASDARGSALPASKQDGLILLPFVYTLQRLQRLAADGSVPFSTLCAEINKMDSGFMELVKVTSQLECLEYAQKHLGMSVRENQQGDAIVSLIDIDLPWLDSPRAGDESMYTLKKRDINALVEILFCCNKPDTTMAWMEYEHLWKLMSGYGNKSFQTYADFRVFCDDASQVCNLGIEDTDKSFRIQLVNRYKPFKSDKMNSDFFDIDLASVSAILAECPIQKYRESMQRCKEQERWIAAKKKKKRSAAQRGQEQKKKEASGSNVKTSA